MKWLIISDTFILNDYTYWIINALSLCVLLVKISTLFFTLFSNVYLYKDMNNKLSGIENFYACFF